MKKNNLKVIKIDKNKSLFNYEKKILIPFFIVFLVEIFPIKTTGSFFTSTNSTFLFILISFIIGIIQIKKIKHD